MSNLKKSLSIQSMKKRNLLRSIQKRKKLSFVKIISLKVFANLVTIVHLLMEEENLKKKCTYIQILKQNPVNSFFMKVDVTMVIGVNTFILRPSMSLNLEVF
mmetsp:Transcript_16390/g.25527  ORF Transcript_16390/g.25527 Transcript_16390/m.25527 type:complete len:102 (+) Transcript_16390:260-565(+)